MSTRQICVPLFYNNTYCMYGVMSSSVHFSRSVKRWLKRSIVSSGRSSTRSRQMVSGREVRSTRAMLWKIYNLVNTAATFSREASRNKEYRSKRDKTVVNLNPWFDTCWPLAGLVLCSCPLEHSAARLPETPSGWTWRRSAAAVAPGPDILYPHVVHKTLRLYRDRRIWRY